MPYRRKPRGKIIATRDDVLEHVKPLEWFDVKVKGQKVQIKGASVSRAIECLREANFIMREDWFGPMGFDLFEGAISKRNQKVYAVEISEGVDKNG